MKHIVLLVLVLPLLGGCSSYMEALSSIDEKGVHRIGQLDRRHVIREPAATPSKERQRLIDELVRERDHHREEALQEIERR